MLHHSIRAYKGFLSLLIIGLLTFASIAFAQSSSEVVFVKVIESGKGRDLFQNFFERSSAEDPMIWKVRRGFSRFGRENAATEAKPVYQLIERSAEEVSPELKEAVNSNEFREVMDMRAQAREIGERATGVVSEVIDQKDGPLFILEPEQPLIQVGPAFLDLTEFKVYRKEGPPIHTNNVMLVEEATLGPIKAFDFNSQKKYLPYILAHENIHALMQEIYGLKAYEELAKGVKSYGHHVWFTTDPALALLEGFPEAVEAYLFEKYSKRPVHVPERKFDRTFTRFVFESVQERTTLNRLSTLFSVDFLIKLNNSYLSASRLPVMTNQYLLEEYLDFGLSMQGFLDPNHSIYTTYDEMNIVTPHRAISREGVVAHQFYVLLKANRFEEIVTVLAKYKPKSYPEFYEGYLAEFPNDSELISRLFFESYSLKGHELNSQIYRIDRRESNEKRAEVASIEDYLLIHHAAEIFEAPTWVDRALQALMPKAMDLKEDLKESLIDWYLISDEKEETQLFRNALGKYFPEAELHRPGISFSTYDTEVRAKIRAAKKGELKSKYQTQDEVRAVYDSITEKYSNLRKKLSTQMEEAFQEEYRERGMQGVLAELHRLPPNIWLRTRESTGIKRQLMGFGDYTINLNIATWREIQVFVSKIYKQPGQRGAAAQPASPSPGLLDHLDHVNNLVSGEPHKSEYGLQWSDVGSIIQSSMAENKNDEIDRLADVIYNARSSNGGFKGVEELRGILPSDWYEEIARTFIPEGEGNELLNHEQVSKD